MQTNEMVINRETAMRIWSKRYGKELKVTDFAGRTMVKSAYDDRDSKYGWNIDHILPQSRGGKTAEHNLICCHILTNDEKGNRFPCFKANGHEFEIWKVQNHYEIKERINANQNDETENVDGEEEVNFYDSASGIRFFKKLKSIQNQWRHTSTIVITLKNYKTTAIIDFIEELFAGYSITHPNDIASSIVIVIQANNVPMKEDSVLLLDKCVILNTYLTYYFIELDYLDSYDIHYWDTAYREKEEMYHSKPQTIWPSTNSLFISKSVVEHTDAKKWIKNPVDEFNEYNIIFTQLRDDLIKEVSKQG